MDIKEKVIEKRLDSRNPYSGHIFFATNSQLFEGELKNFSKHGLYIKTYEILNLGEFITVALPYVDDKKIKVQVIWQNHEGYGVEMVRKRNGNNLQLLKIEAKSR